MHKWIKKAFVIIFIGLFSALIVGCKKKPTELNKDNYMNDYLNRLSEHKIGDVPLLHDKIELDLDNLIFDDFINGVNKDNWLIANQAWGSAANGGVIKENVGYTDDGILILKGNGRYYTEGDVKGVGSIKDGSCAGAALISKFTTRPGRYQIKMKVLPRLGACTAFWVYSYDQSTGNNHEIDIELPGGVNSTHVISFENVLNTNYITVQMRESKDTKISDAKGTDEFITLNDGEWHTFGFDWYTDPELVVYYVDGVVTQVSNIFVPFADTRLWLGLWFPNTSGFVGEPLFESDYMYVDWVEYIPFKNQPCDELPISFGSDQVASDDEYPTEPISIETPNKISNATFEYAKTHSDYENYGWDFTRRNLTSEETQYLKDLFKQYYLINENPYATEEETNAYANEKLKELRKLPSVNHVTKILPNCGMNDSYGVEVKDYGRVRQTIDAVYEGFKVDLNFYSKGNGKVTIQFQNNIDSKISEVVFDINSNTYKLFNLSEIAPEGTKKIMIMIDTTLNNVIYADDFSLYINR